MANKIYDATCIKHFAMCFCRSCREQFEALLRDSGASSYEQTLRAYMDELRDEPEVHARELRNAEHFLEELSAHFLKDDAAHSTHP